MQQKVPKPPKTREPASILARDALIDGYIERAKRGRYQHLKPSPDTRLASDNYAVKESLFSPQMEPQLEEVNQLASAYFDFKIEFFKFAKRPDRSLRDLIRRPHTYADLEEEDLEQKFPGDRKTRALVKAFGEIIRRNQRRHIHMKRAFQAIASLGGLILALLWSYLGFPLCVLAGARIAASTGMAPSAVVWTLWLVLGAIIAALYYGVAVRWAFEAAIGITTSRFKEANTTSSARLAASMTAFNSEISKRFTNLLGVIKSSEDNFELVKRDGWADKTEQLFKIAMWQGKRIESMEKFWQLQFERLRLFELLSDLLGNAYSVAIAIVFVLLTAGLLFMGPALSGNGNQWLTAGILFVSCALLEWHIGSLSRQADESFGMTDIIDQGFEGSWSAFSSLGYYDKIAQEFKNGMGAKHMEKITNRGFGKRD